MSQPELKTIGVLGGMGPESTVLFFQKVVELTPAQTDQEHIPLLIYNDPRVPDRTRAILEDGESALPQLLAGVSVLEEGGADVICIPCNTAHYYYTELVAHSNIPILHLIELACAQAREVLGARKVGLLATRATIESGLYQDILQRANLEVITPDKWELKDLQSVIHRLKNKSREVEATQAFAEGLVDRGSEVVILGCTEFSLVASELKLRVPVVDSVAVLARAAVDFAFGNRPEEQ